MKDRQLYTFDICLTVDIDINNKKDTQIDATITVCS
jgi:hypothetical protein